MWQSLIEQCRASLFPVVCAACDAPVRREVFCARCNSSLEPAPPAAKARAAYAYTGALADALRKAKFHPDETRARALVPLFVDAFADELNAFLHVDAIAFVPSHWRRHIHRGFELPALLATGLSKHTHVPLCPCLRTQRYVPPVAGRVANAKHRKERVMERFRAVGTFRPGDTIVLVDDVVSTGATLHECTRALMQAGAGHVVSLTLAASA